MVDSDTLVWITGATKGLGAGLARTCPYDGARIINLSRSEHPDLENVRFDLGEPRTWDGVRESFRRELKGFEGQRALFVHNAFFDGATGFAGEVDEDVYYRDVLGNAAAPLVLADWFLRAVEPGYESGIVLMSSAAARIPFEGNSVYGAAKAGVEQWVRVARRERARRGSGPWIVAVRPGFVDSPSVRWVADLDPSDYPVAPIVEAALERGEALTPDAAARDIWASLPPPPDQSVLLFGAPPTGVTTGSPAARAVGAYIDLINARRYDDIGDLFAADAEFQAPTGETLLGREAIRAFYSSALRQIAPEEVWVHSAVAEGNRCVIEIAARLPGEPAGSSHVVVDHFTVDAAGFVSRMAVYLRPAEQRETNARVSAQ